MKGIDALGPGKELRARKQSLLTSSVFSALATHEKGVSNRAGAGNLKVEAAGVAPWQRTRQRKQMATNPMNEVLLHLHRAVVLRHGADLTDAQLLENFVSRRDEAALAALVRRHGPMVWGVCRRILPNHHDGEDAFQATFLVFVRKAASIVPREMVANWLYGVARQTAQKARATAIRRKARERQVREMLQPARAQRDLRRDLQPLLDEALSRLSEKYRAVIVLCDLEGKTRKEAARQLACPEGTVAGRLARARAMLAKRLTRRGVASDGALAAVPSGQSIASPELPTSLVASTIKAASLSAVGKAVAKGVISINVEAITEGVLKTMLPTKLKVVAPLLFVMGFVALPCGMLAQEQEGGPREVLRSEREPGAAQAARKQTSKDAGPLPADSIPSRDELHGKWAGEKNGIHVDLTLGEKQAVWKVEFVKTRKPKAPFQSPDVRVSIGADLRCDPDAKASCLGLYLPAYRGDDQQIKKVPALTGRAAVGQIQRGAEGTIRLRIIPTGRENLDQEEYDYPAVEELILRRVAEASK